MRLTTPLLWVGLVGLAGAGIWGILQQWDVLQATSQQPVLPPKPSQSPTNNSGIATVPATILVGAGDIADCTKSEDTLTAELIDQIPGTVFTTGDDAYPRGTAAEFQQCYEPTWGRFKTRTYPTPGNHEYYSPDAAPYYAYFGARAGDSGKGYYSYNLGAWHIIALNSNIDAQKGSPQQQWLRADLASHSRDCTLAYWHHPVFSSGPHGNDSKMQDVWQTLYEVGADVVVNGHDHHYERFAPQTSAGQADPQRGIREFVVGTGGAALRPAATKQPHSEVLNTQTHGVLKFTLRAKSYDWEFVPVRGQTFTDKGSDICGSAT